MDPADLRAEIPACESCAYLNTGASGPAPRPVVEAVADAQRRHEFGACDTDHYDAAATLRSRTRERLADHLGCAPGDVALVASTGDGLARVAGAVDWVAGDRVVRTDLEHPSGVLPWRRLETEGVEVATVECPDGRLPTDAYREAVADARLVCLSSESWLHGTRLPVAEAVDIAHDAGALVVVDAVQTIGQRAVDVTEWGADVVCASGHKWLLGPWGTGFLYVAPDALSSLRPRQVGYRSVVDPTGPGFEYAPDASRFEVSTTAVAPYAGLLEAIDLLESVGMGTAESRIAGLVDRLESRLGDRVRPGDGASGLVAFDVADAERFVERARAADVVVRGLPSGEARASVHVFNTEADVDALADLL